MRKETYLPPCKLIINFTEYNQLVNIFENRDWFVNQPVYDVKTIFVYLIRNKLYNIQTVKKFNSLDVPLISFQKFQEEIRKIVNVKIWCDLSPVKFVCNSPKKTKQMIECLKVVNLKIPDEDILLNQFLFQLKNGKISHFNNVNSFHNSPYFQNTFSDIFNQIIEYKQHHNRFIQRGDTIIEFYLEKEVNEYSIDITTELRGWEGGSDIFFIRNIENDIIKAFNQKENFSYELKK